MKKSRMTARGDDFMSRIRSDALHDFNDVEYRHAYCDDFLNISVATQIKALRERRGMTQDELASETGMKQSRISALEDVNYASWSINTLRRLAKAFDVTLTVKFESFGDKLVDIDLFSRTSPEIPMFKDDPEFSQRGHTRRKPDGAAYTKRKREPPH